MAAVETKTCCARIGHGNMRLGAPRRGARCGAPARDTVQVSESRHTLFDLCGVHLAVLARAENPFELAKRWLP